MSEVKYPNNSNAAREAQTTKPVPANPDAKRVNKVVQGKVKTKKNEVRRFKDIFISEDAANVKSYILMDVLVPAVKKAISDIVTNGIDMVLYGGKGSPNRKSISSKVSYSDYYANRNGGDRFRPSQAQVGPRYNYEDIILEYRGEAEEVLDRLNECIEIYKVARVADLYDLVGKTGTYTDNNYGWTNLSAAKVVRVNDGYWLDMPKAKPIDR